jgi:hypothetical protein
MENNTIVQIYRYYKKFINLLSTVGGTAKSLVFIGAIIMNRLNLTQWHS